MRNLFFLPLIALIMLGCNASKEKQNESTKLVLENSKQKLVEVVTYKKWIAVQKNGGSGYKLTITPNKNKQTEFKTLYFRGLKGELINNKVTLTKSLNNDIQLSSNPKDEYSNTLPNNGISDFPFLLKQDECVISYIESDTIKFIKVTNLKEVSAEFYPSAKPQND